MQIRCSYYTDDSRCEIVSTDDILAFPPRRVVQNSINGTGRVWECTSNGLIRIPLFGSDCVTIHFRSRDRWDGASIPSILRCIIGDRLDDRWATATFIHDKFCDMSQDLVVRQLGDVLFWHVLRMNSKIPRWRRISMFLGVRIWSVIRLILWQSNDRRQRDTAG